MIGEELGHGNRKLEKGKGKEIWGAALRGWIGRCCSEKNRKDQDGNS